MLALKPFKYRYWGGLASVFVLFLANSTIKNTPNWGVLDNSLYATYAGWGLGAGWLAFLSLAAKTVLVDGCAANAVSMSGDADATAPDTNLL